MPWGIEVARKLVAPLIGIFDTSAMGLFAIGLFVFFDGRGACFWRASHPFSKEMKRSLQKRVSILATIVLTSSNYSEIRSARFVWELALTIQMTATS